MKPHRAVALSASVWFSARLSSTSPNRTARSPRTGLRGSDSISRERRRSKINAWNDGGSQRLGCGILLSSSGCCGFLGNGCGGGGCGCRACDSDCGSACACRRPVRQQSCDDDCGSCGPSSNCGGCRCKMRTCGNSCDCCGSCCERNFCFHPFRWLGNLFCRDTWCGPTCGCGCGCGEGSAPGESYGGGGHGGSRVAITAVNTKAKGCLRLPLRCRSRMIRASSPRRPVALRPKLRARESRRVTRRKQDIFLGGPRYSRH